MKKNLVYRGARAIYRLSRNWLANRRDHPVLILTYHRVTQLDSDPQQLAVTPDNFRRQMQWLRSRHPLLRLEDDWHKRGRPGVVITFDDGYADNVREALPILEELQIPATFFITTAYVGADREFWWDELERLVLLPDRLPERFEFLVNDLHHAWTLDGMAARQRFYQELHALLKPMPPEMRDDWLAALRSWSGATGAARESHKPLSHAQLRHLAASPMATIGGHTVSHTPLRHLPIARQQEEICRCRDELQTWAGKPITVFSYPFGAKSDYGQETAAIVRQAGFAKAVANFPGAAHDWTDAWQLPRHVMRNWDMNTFPGRIRRCWLL